MIGKTRLLVALAGFVAIFAACSADAPTGDTSSANAGDTASIVDHDQTATAHGAWHDRGARHDPTCAPTFTMCSDGQIAFVVDALTRYHDWQWEHGMVAPPVQRRIESDSTHIREALAAVVAHDGITPTPTAYGTEMDRRRDALTNAGSWAGGNTPLRAFLAGELLSAAQNLSLLDHVLLPSVDHDRLRDLLHEARSTIASELPMILDAQQAEAQGACGDELGPTGEIPRVRAGRCSAPAFAACSDRQIESILATEYASILLFQHVIDRFALDPRVVALAHRMRDDATRLQSITPTPPATTVDNGVVRAVRRMSSHEVSYEQALDVPNVYVDRGFMHYELLEMLTMIGLIDHVLIPSARDDALRAALAEARETFAGDLRALVALDNEYVGPCGTPAPTSDAGADASADASCATDPPAP